MYRMKNGVDKCGMHTPNIEMLRNNNFKLEVNLNQWIEKLHRTIHRMRFFDSNRISNI